ncbi:MAG: type II restriction endonuclease [Akkermansiaceae bacterium]
MNEFKRKTFTECLEIIDRSGFNWMVKRLSGNDTGLSEGHQSGVYFTPQFIRQAIPEISTTQILNPDKNIDCYFPQYDLQKTLRAIYYNNRHIIEDGKVGTRNEFRITRWGGAKNPVQDPESTGNSFLFALKKIDGHYHAISLMAGSEVEEDLLEEWLGAEIEPKRAYDSFESSKDKKSPTYPLEWHTTFPKGREIYEYITAEIPRKGWVKGVDALLLERRSLEFQIFGKIEEAHLKPFISKGFRTVDDFVKLANSVTNRRKSRSGTSLELNLEAIFIDEKLKFETQVETEHKKKPDFIFPSSQHYHNHEFPSDRLNMLAAKTCCKDRWRQVINEADRISPKHLFTLQEGVSINQLSEMNSNNIQLVIPRQNLKSFPVEWRSSLLSLEQFVDIVRDSQINQLRL